MSLFSIGGNLGVALGPLAAGFAAAHYGLHGAALLVIPAAIVSALMFASLPRLAVDGVAGEARAAAGPSDAHTRELVILLWAVAARGYVYTGLVSFIPLLEQRVRHHSADHGSRVLTILLMTGALGTLVFGPLADRIGRQRIFFWSFVACVPATMLYLADGGLLGLLGLAISGACLCRASAYDRALAGVPAGTHGHGCGSLDRSLDRTRRHRGDLRRRPC